MSERYKSITQVSEMTGVDRRTLKKRFASLKVHMQEGKAQLYDMFEASKYIHGGEVADLGNIEQQMATEQLRLETAKADKIELEVGKLRSELVSIEEVASVVEREYGAVRAGILSMPSKVAQDLVLMDNFLTIKNYLEDAVNEVLTELSADTAYADKHYPPSEELGTSNVTTTSDAPIEEPSEDAQTKAAP